MTNKQLIIAKLRLSASMMQILFSTCMDDVNINLFVLN